MSYDAKVFQVMITSPADVAAECRVIRECVHDWNDMHSYSLGAVLLPIGWDTHAAPAMGERPQSIINRQVLKYADLLVAVFWTRIGSDTGKAISGTVEEIEEHLGAGKPAMVYFSSQPVRLDSINTEQYEALRVFKASCLKRGLVETFGSPGELAEKFTRQLTRTVATDSYFSDRLSDVVFAEGGLESEDSNPDLSSEASKLLISAAQDRNGYILFARHLGGVQVSTNGRQFIENPKDPRSRAIWEGVVSELCDLGLLEERGHKGEVFAVTRDGYQFADRLGQQ